jgi:hypothetical protein
MVLTAHEAAARGFPPPPDMPFGLGALHAHVRQSREEQ